MRDYEELVSCLRIEADGLLVDDKPDMLLHDSLRDAADAIEELSVVCRAQKAAFDAYMDKMPKWISVEERLPEDGESIIAVIEDYSTWDDDNDDIAVSAEPNGAMTVIGIYRNKRFRWYDESGAATIDMNDSDIENLGLRLVSWMPLPEPPKEDDNA